VISLSRNKEVTTITAEGVCTAKDVLQMAEELFAQKLSAKVGALIVNVVEQEGQLSEVSKKTIKSLLQRLTTSHQAYRIAIVYDSYAQVLSLLQMLKVAGALSSTRFLNSMSFSDWRTTAVAWVLRGEEP
jgi:hypothetical protein